jgi:RimJ/RimL family protein N-acetyltransferase
MTVMNKKSLYLECPVFDTEHFLLRLVQEDDAADLLTCYSDPNARVIFNSDMCSSSFYYDTSNEVRECIKAWLGCYAREEFVRFSIVDKSTHHAIGTIEMFGMVGKYKTARGILRLDIASKYEESAYLNELFSLCLKEFFELFGVQQIVTKAIPEAAVRVDILNKLVFTAYDFPEREHYWLCASDGLDT